MNEISITKLNKDYGNHAIFILREFLKELPHERKRGVKRKFKVLKTLPTPEEFTQLRNKAFTTDVPSLVNDAFEEMEALKDKLQDWFDNLPESFQQGDKGSSLEEAISTLDNIQAPDVPECASGVSTVHIPAINIDSRSKRLSEAISQLESAKSALEGKIEEFDEKIAELEEKCVDEKTTTTEVADADADEDDLRSHIDEMQSLIDELDNLISETEGVEFPGMYG